MKQVLIIGSGISGMACALRCAEHGIHAELISPYPSERAQSVMAAGGINAVLHAEDGDSVECHIRDTLQGGAMLGGEQAVTGLCTAAPEIIRYLERIGTVFSLDAAGKPAKRAFGGQSFRRTYFCGASTGKQIVSAMIMEVRRFEAAGLIRRRLRYCFHSALLHEDRCCGALLFNEKSGHLEAVTADALILATGGQNALFGKTTGSTQCNGYAAGKLFLQGAELKNLEFIQYHPTTLETPQKRMLISEAVRGEGGRLFYEENGERCYFMEERYGERGNLMTRDVIAREIERAGKPVFLDIAFLGREQIGKRLPEVRDICQKYRGIDIAREPIPVAPSVHFFMGGLAVHRNHETSLRNVFAIGECASMYHGANRLGGNSLLSAIYSGWVAADEIAGRASNAADGDFSRECAQQDALLQKSLQTESRFPVMYIRDMLAETMQEDLGIVRAQQHLEKGLSDIDYLLSVAEQIRYDSSVQPYDNYSLTGILTLAKAVLTCALARTESRGAHYRSDFPETDSTQGFATLISYSGGAFRTRLDKDGSYEN